MPSSCASALYRLFISLTISLVQAQEGRETGSEGRYRLDWVLRQAIYRHIGQDVAQRATTGSKQKSDISLVGHVGGLYWQNKVYGLIIGYTAMAIFFQRHTDYTFLLSTKYPFILFLSLSHILYYISLFYCLCHPYYLTLTQQSLYMSLAS